MQDSRFEMKYLEEESLFEMAWYDKKEEEEEQQRFFSVRFTPETFEQMSYDMLRMVKDFNLKQALEHQKKQECRLIED